MENVFSVKIIFDNVTNNNKQQQWNVQPCCFFMQAWLDFIILGLVPLLTWRSRKKKKCNAIIRVSPEFVIIAIIVFYNTLNVLIDSTAVLEIPPINTRTRLKVNLIPRHFPREYIYEY